MTFGYGTLGAVTDVDPSPSGSADATTSASAPAFTADDLVRWTGGRLLARSERPIRGAAVDSRLVEPGQVFVALPGERTDGHGYLADAIARGASAVIVARPMGGAGALGAVSALHVADPLAALGAVGAGLEMGMYGGGEIADLARIARPRIGVVTAVQAVHLSRIGSLDAIEQAKGELLEALPPDGAAILNADDPIVRRMGARSEARSLN